MRTILNKLVVIGVGIAVCAGCGSGAGTGSGSSGGRVRIVAAESFWGSIAQQIAGPDGEVTSIVNNPNADPHDYEPTPQDARSVASAKLLIENGIGYDAWAQRLADASGVSGQTVLDVGKLLGVPDGGNPHQWYSQASVAQFVAQVTRDLEKIDPAHRAAYASRGNAFETKTLAGYAALIDRIKQAYAGTPIGASESIVTPLAQTLGLKLLTPSSFVDAIAEGNEPTASAKATADAQIEQRKIKVFVFNSQNSTPDVQRLVDAAQRERIPVITVTETLTPAKSTFQDWQVRQLRALLAALDKKGTA